jgi:hypothetical protein
VSGIGLPKFRRTKEQQYWIEGEDRTARFIQKLWKAASPSTRRDPDFIVFLTCCGWTNIREDKTGFESTRRWRNNKLAEYLGVPYQTDDQLADALVARLPRLNISHARHLLASHTGFSVYYTSFRPQTLKFVRKHADAFHKCFADVASDRLAPDAKIKSVVDRILALGSIVIRDKKISALNSTTPALASIDPTIRFPVMNRRTEALLRAIGAQNDAEGALALSALIGRNGIKNSRELDIYTIVADFSKVRPAKRINQTESFRDLAIKSELMSFASIAGKRVAIRKEHNELTNRILKYLLWRHVVSKESRFDVLVKDWKNGRDLLIEAKTGSTGSAGRTQIRQAIGQLFDYRHTHFPNARTVDLAVLLPRKPARDILDLLRSPGIECLWFEGRGLLGTIDL